MRCFAPGLRELVLDRGCSNPELPLYEKALSSSPSIPETIRKRVQLATFCHDVFGKQEDKALASASQRFEGDQIIPEEFDRHDGFWDLALELRTQVRCKGSTTDRRTSF